jgi:cytochrome c553
MTSERDVTMTFEVWKASSQKVTDCRACHFQDGNVPEGKTMPKATYTDAGKSTTKDMNNQLAYHINCNTCHDAAAKLRPELKKKPGFATSKDCAVCHKTTT